MKLKLQLPGVEIENGTVKSDFRGRREANGNEPDE